MCKDVVSTVAAACGYLEEHKQITLCIDILCFPIMHHALLDKKKIFYITTPPCISSILQVCEMCEKARCIRYVKVELFHLTFAPSLNRRNLEWTRHPPDLSSAVQHTPGFYDAPIGEVTIVFIQFTPPKEGESKESLSKQVFEAYLELAMRCVRAVLLETGGYIIPRRGGRTMAAFTNMVDAAHFFTTLVARLRTMVWDDRAKRREGSMDGFKALPHALAMQHNHITFNSTGSVTDADQVQINLSDALPKGMMCSGGLCHGSLTKQVEASGCADYQGPAANRAAR